MSFISKGFSKLISSSIDASVKVAIRNPRGVFGRIFTAADESIMVNMWADRSRVPKLIGKKAGRVLGGVSALGNFAAHFMLGSEEGTYINAAGKRVTGRVLSPVISQIKKPHVEKELSELRKQKSNLVKGFIDKAKSGPFTKEDLGWSPLDLKPEVDAMKAAGDDPKDIADFVKTRKSEHSKLTRQVNTRLKSINSSEASRIGYARTMAGQTWKGSKEYAKYNELMSNRYEWALNRTLRKRIFQGMAGMAVIGMMNEAHFQDPSVRTYDTTQNNRDSMGATGDMALAMHYNYR